jgi:FAD synthase
MECHLMESLLIKIMTHMKETSKIINPKALEYGRTRQELTKGNLKMGNLFLGKYYTVMEAVIKGTL